MVFNPQDHIRLGDKTLKRNYECYESFLADVKGIEHNVKVHHKGEQMIMILLKYF